MEIFRKKLQFIRKDNDEEIVKQQSTLTFDSTDKYYTNYDSYTFQQSEILMDKPIYLRFATLDLTKTLMYET